MDDGTNYIPNFILGKSAVPIKQPWEYELEKFKQSKVLFLTYTIKPKFLKFKKTTADKLALATIPICTFIQALFVSICFLHLNIRSFWWWLFAIPTFVVFGTLVYKLISQIICEMKVKIHNNNIPENISVVVYDGPPGTGKTSALCNDYKNLADSKWFKICEKYAFYEPFLEDIPLWPQKEKEDAIEIIEAYNFYKTSNSYPCLWSTVPAFVDGVPVNKLTADHLMQRKRLPYGAVCIIDETSLVLPQELFRDKPYEVVEMCKFPRHFGDFNFGSTEQDEDSNLIYLRRVAGLTNHMLAQEWIKQPKFLQWIYDKLFNIRFKRPFTKNASNFFKLFKQYIKAFGYRKYYYTNNISPGVQTFLLKPNLCLDYDDRCYKNAYRCLNKPLEKSTWEYLRPSKRDIDQIFSDELKQRGKSHAQLKREAAQKRLTKEKKYGRKKADNNG